MSTNKNQLIIGITGTLGSGKGTIVKYLINQKGFAHFSVRSYLLKEISNRNMPANRDSMVLVANDLRENNSPSFITDQLFLEAKELSKDCIIESVRTPGEVDSLRKKGHFLLFAVDADPLLRYKRIKIRSSETDQIDFETFQKNEIREMDSDDPNKQNIRKCIQMADYLFLNNGSRIGLEQQVEDVLQLIEKG